MRTIVKILAWFVLLLQSGGLAVATDEVEPAGRVPAWKGDFPEMLERRQIRVLVTYNRLMYFLDGANPRGSAYEWMEAFCEFIDDRYDLEVRGIQAIYLPVPHDRLIPALLEGRGDVVLSNLKITAARKELVDFTEPLAMGVREILVTGPSAPPIMTYNDLAGRVVHVRASSRYFTSLNGFNRQLIGKGLAPMRIEPVDEFIEDEDLLEMVNAGVLGMTVVDAYKAKAWSQVFEAIEVREDVAFSDSGQIAVAIRKDSPGLRDTLNEFIEDTKKGSLLGNILINRYYRDNRWMRGTLEPVVLARRRDLVRLFRKYGERYRFDWLMLAALAYQESGLKQSVRSHAGAIGVMQLLPATADDPNVNVGDIEELDNNIHAGAKYLGFLRDRYFTDDAIDQVNKLLLTVAAYNAGPSRISELRSEAESRGLDPNTWFGHVEQVVARRVGRETVQYVGNIYKYYVAYKLIERQGFYGRLDN